jgi:hypothetical protein
MKNWSKQQKREHEVMLKVDELKKDNSSLYWSEKIQSAMEAYFRNKNAIQEYTGRLKNLNVYLEDSIERINDLMEEK